MPAFKVKTRDETLIDVPDGVELSLQGLRIIGDNVPDWNEPIQQNMMKLSNDNIITNEAVVLKADKTAVYTKAESDAKVSEALDAYNTELGTVADLVAQL